MKQASHKLQIFRVKQDAIWIQFHFEFFSKHNFTLTKIISREAKKNLTFMYYY